jgi:hypothetical protein
MKCESASRSPFFWFNPSLNKRIQLSLNDANYSGEIDINTIGLVATVIKSSNDSKNTFLKIYHLL